MVARAFSLGAVLAAVSLPASAHHGRDCHTRECHARVAERQAMQRVACKSRACKRRTCRSRACRERVEMKRYKRSPMPRCTWYGESGAGNGEWSRVRYRARNSSSTAAGKFQMLDTTFHGYGGPSYPGSHDAAQARPVVQERIARRVLRGQGLGAWVLC